MKLPESWIEARLDDVLNRVDAKIDPQSSSISSHFYVGLEHIESHTGRLLREAEDKTDGSDILSIKTQFKTGDILYGKLRPNLNKVYLAEQDGICSTDIWALRPISVIIPEFAVQYLRSAAVHVRTSQLAAGANLPRVPASSFDRIPIVLPTVLEQQRIVDLFGHLNVVAKAKQTINEQIDQLVRTAYWEHFSEWYTKDGLVDPVRISEYVADSQYGVSEAMEGTGSHAVLRMNSITTSGWLDLTDLKYANLSKKDIKATALQDGDLLFNRTNSKELVGKCAIWRDTAGAFSYASYLVRFRLKEGMLPEFLWATLNSAYGKYRLLNSAKQAVSMANVSPTDLGRITVPLPPIALQEKFAYFVRQIEKLREQMLSNLAAFSELQAVVTQQALLGDLTAQWREQNKAKIEVAALERDAFLAERGLKATSSTGDSKSVPVPEHSERLARHWLINELSELQYAVWTMLRHEWRNLVIVDDPEAFNDFCTNEQTTWPIEHFNASPNRIRRTLEQLAGLGLIAKVSVPRQNASTLQTDYLTAFRPLRNDENTRLRDAAMLKGALNKNEQSETSGGNSDKWGSW
ncbi:restriction endonuclease subunit S [Methylomonas methanica]|uniref:Restriction modification system DNA specificity domain protein n=1 Tax=Methylomonas methanica (strain DSM 25384 / MC09) TaxID=857087 RepID=G0A4S6_METMM|nr:restriction endonuclease subunit S [Methylomonas methanica]AEG02817.1 restriction modification system DNA specificity domain protein [Methylomonas methanica MC09]